MHILEIPSFFTPYGGEFCLEQAKALKAQGNEVRILSNVQLSIKKSIKDFLFSPYARFTENIEGIVVYRSYQHGVPKLIHFNVNRWVSIVRSMFKQYVDRYGKPDILHAHCCKWAGYAAMLISNEYGIPYAITEHLSSMLYEKEFGKAPSLAWQIPLLKQAFSNASVVITVSDELVDDISCYFGKDYNNYTISNIIDTSFFTYKKRESLVDRPFRFCCIANNEYWKGYDILLSAFNKLVKQQSIYPQKDVELHIAGRNTLSKDFLRMIKESGSEAKIIVHGELNKKDIRELLYKCDCLVLPSRSEVQPLCILEAMSSGIPYISTEIIPRNLRLCDSCKIVPVDDADALYLSMHEMINNYSSVDNKQLSDLVSKIASPEIVGKQLHTLFLHYIKT